MRTKISVSIVTYNSASEIESVLDSLMLSRDTSDLEIYVVDNDSHDDTVSIIQKKYPTVNLIRSKENVGFGAGHNKAIRAVDSKYHIMINPDIKVLPDVINQLSEYMNSHTDVVIASPKILNDDGTVQYLPKRYPKIKYFLGGRFESKGSTFRNWRAKYTRSNEQITEPLEIDFCTGCFMFCRMSVLKECDGFDERYFLHFEDADLTREMKKYGKTVFIPNISVTHMWKRENGKSGKVFRIALLSMLKYFWKWRRG